jgi:hypothetical protein
MKFSQFYIFLYFVFSQLFFTQNFPLKLDDN